MLPTAARLAVAAALTCCSALPALADPGHGRGHGHGHGHGHGRHGHGEARESFHDGACHVERRWDKHGGYREQRRCDGGVVYAPVYVPAPAPAVVVPSPGVYVQTPGVVIQPPAIVIR